MKQVTTAPAIHYHKGKIMIIETPYKDNDIVSFKMNSGEEIVARLTSHDTTGYTVSKPMVLVFQNEALALAPFMFSVPPTGKFVLQSNSVSCIAKTESEISKKYTTTTTGIVT